MSSDSSSDLDDCDIFTKFRDKIAKSEENFWDKYNVHDDEANRSRGEIRKQPEEAILVEDDVMPDNSTCTTQHNIITSEHNTSTSEHNTITSQHNTITSQHNTSVSEHNTSLSENQLERINAYLDNMKQKVNNALRKPIRGAGKRKRWSQKRVTRSSRRLTNIAPKPSIVCPPVSISDEEDILDIVTIDLNPIVHIRVLWRGVESQTFKLKKFQTLTPIKEYYVRNKDANPNLLFFTINEKEIDLDNNSWVSLRMDHLKVIEGSLLPETYLNNPNNFYIDPSYDYCFKVQTSDTRHKGIKVKCKKDDKVEYIFWHIIHQTGKDIHEFKLYFDGQLLKPDQELSELDVMDGDCFDLL